MKNTRRRAEISLVAMMVIFAGASSASAMYELIGKNGRLIDVKAEYNGHGPKKFRGGDHSYLIIQVAYPTSDKTSTPTADAANDLQPDAKSVFTEVKGENVKTFRVLAYSVDDPTKPLSLHEFEQMHHNYEEAQLVKIIWMDLGPNFTQIIPSIDDPNVVVLHPNRVLFVGPEADDPLPPKGKKK